MINSNPFTKTKLKIGERHFDNDKPVRSIITIYEKLIGGKMKPSGRATNVCCPIHSEEHPSCALYADTNSFYCFSCGAEGDYITFVMRTQGVDFKEALKIIEKL